MASKDTKNESDLKESSQPSQPEALGLHWTEWAFNRVADDKLRYCAMWELDRVRGAKLEPWLKLSEEAQAEYISHYRGLWEIPEQTGPVRYFGSPESDVGVFGFIIDFQQTEEALVSEFREWLTSKQQAVRQCAAPPKKSHWRSVLTSIVILRAREAGLKRRAAIKKTSELWDAWTAKCEDGLTSAAHWSRALKQGQAFRKEQSSISRSFVESLMLRTLLASTDQAP